MTSAVRRCTLTPHATAAFPARCLAGQGVAKPVATKPSATKPIATKPSATKPSATKPIETTPIATKRNGLAPITIKRTDARRGAVKPRRDREAGMTTAEYAIGTVAACSFAALLIAIVRSPEIKAALLSVITGALGLGG